MPDPSPAAGAPPLAGHVLRRFAERARRHPWICAFLGACLLFLAFPGIDIWVSRLFYDPAAGFVCAKSGPALAIFHSVSRFARLCSYGIPLLIGLSFLPLFARLRDFRKHMIFMILLLALGPGLVAHSVFKEHFGRARPNQIVAFGGSAQFSPALIPARECARNCSFVSGHAAMGFYPLGLAFAFPRRRRTWLSLGLVSGSVAGLGRVVQGAHFLSDVVFAGFVVYACAYWLQRWLPAAEERS